MPPKKDDKKGKKSNVKVVDPAEYIRAPTAIETSLLNDSPTNPLSGKIANVETLFPEWNDIESEAWSQPIAPEYVVDVVYPKNLAVASYSSIKNLFSLNLDPPVDPKAKAPKKDKKAKDAEPELVEMLSDFSGNPMPVMFKSSSEAATNEFLAFEYPRPFYKEYGDKVDDSEKASADSSAPVLEHSPVGAEIDCYICCALRSVKRFAPAIIESLGDESFSNNYLWRAIYPKLPSGKPCFNPAGKYCVRLFLAGKWRKVYVDDVIPLREDGRPALASSSDPHELWPLVLAKAIYAVYSACGYSAAVDDVDSSVKIATKDLMKLIKSNQITIPHKISSFVSFAVHLLTGWQPSSPMSVTSVFLNEKTRSIKLLLSITAAGVIEIDEEDFIDDSADGILDLRGAEALRFGGGGGETPSAAVSSSPFAATSADDEGVILKTKKRFQEEYQIRKARRDAMLETIAVRERKIGKIQAAMNLSLSEVFLLVVFDRTFNKWRVLPVLGVCYPKGGTGSLVHVKILVDWKTGPPIRDPAADSAARPKMSRPDDFPLPDVTPLRCEWTTIDDLMKGNAYIFSVDTLLKTPFHASLGRHWRPLQTSPAADGAAAGRSKSPEKGAKKSAKEAKGAAQATKDDVSGKDLTCVDQGIPPVTLLKLDISSFYHMVSVDDEGKALDEGQVDQVATGNPTDGDAEVSEAIFAQEQELLQSASGVSLNAARRQALKPKKGYLSLSVMLHGDITLSAHKYNDVEVEGEKKKRDAGEKNLLPADAVLILQEVRLDNVEPMMYVMDLKRNAYLPIAQKTFLIPQNKLPVDPATSGPLFFWVRLFTTSSLYIHFSSAVPVVVGDAELVWPSEANRHVFIKEGDAGVTQPNTEQLLFRCPLLKTSSSTPKKTRSGDGEAEGVRLVDAETEAESGGDREFCMSFVFVGDRERARNISLKTITNVPATQPPHAQGVSEQGEKHELHGLDEESGEAVTLVGAVEPLHLGSAPPNGFASLFYGKQSACVAGFHWKLLVLSFSPIVEPSKPIQEVPVVHRYGGKYFANNKLNLFKDVYSFDKSSFPIALRLALRPLAPSEGEASEGGGDTENIRLVVRFFRKSDGACVSEHTGTGIVQIYSQPIEPFLVGMDVERPPTASKKDPKAKGGKAPAIETIDVIIECSVDDRFGVVADALKARLPHSFDASPSTAAKSEPLFQWQLDVLSGRVTSVAHDTSDLQRYAAEKNGWEEGSAGREERAIAAAVYSKERKKKESLELDDPEKTKLTKEMVDALVVALSNSNVEEVRQRYELIHRVPVYEENIELLSQTLREMDLQWSKEHVDPVAEEDESLSSAGSAMSEGQRLFPTYKEVHGELNAKTFEETKKRLEAYVEMLRGSVKDRIEMAISMSDDNARELAKVWPQRESYRLDVERKNQALAALLKRAKDAIQIIHDIENPPLDPKAKKKK